MIQNFVLPTKLVTDVITALIQFLLLFFPIMYLESGQSILDSAIKDPRNEAITLWSCIVYTKGQRRLFGWRAHDLCFLFFSLNHRVTINLIHNQSPPELSTSNIGFKKSYTVCLYLELIKNRNFQHLQRYLYKVDNILVLW